ncbi:MAG: hypothetical protein KDK24_03510 [Pseudooceanicola sp.]|nr:hypothetical protein [Pseudooceanicola sp.]
MEPDPQHPALSLTRALERPAQTLAMVAQMLVGLGLFVALVLKVYMLIFSDHVCEPDSQTLGNMIRCTPLLALIAHSLILVAGVRLAALMFSPPPVRLLGPLLPAVSGVVLLALSSLTLAAEWQAALILGVLFAGLGALAAAQRFWR